jgi:pSer/pThr/pTyr-binding forkhead associated (FHA) protein
VNPHWWNLAFSGIIYLFLITALIAVVSELVRPSRHRGPQDAAKVRLTPLDDRARSARFSSEIPLGSEAWIGRSEENTIPVNDSHASNQHALLRRRQDGLWWLEDLGSTNGTYLNENRVTEPQVVRSGDIIRIGRARFRIRS